MNKFIVVTLLGLVLVGSTPSRVHAQLATFEANPAIITSLGVIANAQIADRAKKDLLDGVAWAVAKVAVQSMTKSIVTWINSGYEGSPAFSQNLTRDLRQAGDAIAGAFLTDVMSGAIESPFSSDLAKNAVSAYYLLTSEDALAERLRFSLANYTQYSTEFIRGDITKGGLSGWFGITFRCENDPSCAAFITREALYNKIDAQVRRQLAEFSAGRGFLSWQGECHDTEPSLSDAKGCVNYDILTPGSVVEQTLVDSLGSPIRQLELADSVNEIVGAVVTQMVGQVLGGGGLAGLSSPRSGGGGSVINQATNPATNGTNTSISGGFDAIVENERTKTLRFRNDWDDIRIVALEAEEACPVGGSNPSLFRASRIDQTVKRAEEKIAEADAALASLDEIAAFLEESSESNNVRAGQDAFQMYQDMLRSGELITDTEVSDAAKERDEDSSSSYSTMRGYAEQCD